MNNYDRIKSMSVEEMAEFIERMTEHLEICTRCPAYKMCDAHIKCGENIKQWLLQEVSEDVTKIEHNSLCETETYKGGV